MYKVPPNVLSSPGTEYITDKNYNDNRNNHIDYDDNQTGKHKKKIFLHPSLNKKPNGSLFYKKRFSLNYSKVDF